MYISATVLAAIVLTTISASVNKCSPSYIAVPKPVSIPSANYLTGYPATAVTVYSTTTITLDTISSDSRSSPTPTTTYITYSTLSTPPEYTVFSSSTATATANPGPSNSTVSSSAAYSSISSYASIPLSDIFLNTDSITYYTFQVSYSPSAYSSTQYTYETPTIPSITTDETTQTNNIPPQPTDYTKYSNSENYIQITGSSPEAPSIPLPAYY
ncbi:hypothetical protein BX070DRAFT_222125 [Coemansia spiralis]|nr:hypothetical protein BX070DRAFT_222125 [Coemansia spiralis]